MADTRQRDPYASVGHNDPYFDDGMRRWIISYARKNYWRVAAWYDDLEDLIQDGMVCYYKCRERYVDNPRPRVDKPTKVLPKENPTAEHRRWMMAIVRTSFVRHVRYTIAGKVRWGREIPASQLAPLEEEPMAYLDRVAPASGDDPTLLSVLLGLPTELQEVIVALANDSGEAARYLSDRLFYQQTEAGNTRIVRRPRRLRETTNEYYCRLLGLDPARHDLRARLLDLF